jgi:hypothetical protein
MSGTSPVRSTNRGVGLPPSSGTAQRPVTSTTLENYFNYFTEIEECFRRCRDTTTLLSPLDWALIESWKEAGVPLEAALLGIERAFQKYAKRPRPFEKVNSLAYCAQSVMRAAEEIKAAEAEGGVGRGEKRSAPAPFTAEEIEAYLRRSADALEKASRRWQENGESLVAEDLAEASVELGRAAETPQWETADLQPLENTLSALEIKLAASVTRAAPVELLAEIRRDVERGLVPYRRTMTGPQIESLERQFLKKRLFEHYGVPRLSLFYL